MSEVEEVLVEVQVEVQVQDLHLLGQGVEVGDKNPLKMTKL